MNGNGFEGEERRPPSPIVTVFAVGCTIILCAVLFGIVYGVILNRCAAGIPMPAGFCW